MATNLFQGGGQSTSDGGGNDNLGGTFMNQDSVAHGHKYVAPVDRGPSTKKLFPDSFDAMAAAKLSGDVRASTWSNKMLSPKMFYMLRDKVFGANKIEAQEDALIESFIRAMCISHAKNSGSTIQPDRAGFSLTYNGTTYEYNYFSDIADLLSEDHRRFMREYADLTRTYLKELLAKRGDPDFAEDIRDIEWVARDRGLERYPHLVHDSAEACSKLSRAEGLALASSKQSVLAQYRGGNPVDNPVLLRSEGGRGGGGRAHQIESGSVLSGPDYSQ